MLCGAVDGRRRAVVSGSEVWQCTTCELTQCDPLPHIEAPSSGASTILTEESFTEAMLRPTEAQRSRYEQLARGRWELYSRDLGRQRFRMLEIGCGAGGLGPPMRALGVEYEGIDLDHRPVDGARQRGEGDGLTVGDFMADAARGTWDVIFATQVLEHITRPVLFVEKITGCLAPSGILHLDVPSQATLAGVPSRLLRGIGSRFGAIDWPHHAIAYGPTALRRLLEPSYRVQIFTASPADPMWGQAVVPGCAALAYYRGSRVLNRESLLVAYGRSRPGTGPCGPVSHGEVEV